MRIRELLGLAGESMGLFARVWVRNLFPPRHSCRYPFRRFGVMLVFLPLFLLFQVWLSRR